MAQQPTVSLAFPEICVSAALVFIAGCGTPGGGGSGDAKLVSAASGATLNARTTTAVYATGVDANVVDFYLSDLPPSVWERGGDVSTEAGSMIHIHMFVAARAGSTPIEQSASTATVRWLVLGRGQVGVYGGGGFFTKSGDVGDETLGGSISAASLRLLHATAGFSDKLGPSTLAADFDATKDEAAAAAMGRAFLALGGSAVSTTQK